MKVVRKIIAFVLLIIIIGSNKITIAQNSYIQQETTMYFLSAVTKNRGNGDCILLENNGQYALIDTGTSATQEQVIQYLQQKKVKQLEFILITHSHADHIGASLKIVQTIPVKKLYIKEYKEEYVVQKAEQATYTNLLQLAKTKNIEIIGPASQAKAFNQNNTQFTFGTAKIQILNWEIKCNSDGTRKIVNDENENSLGVLVTQGSKKAFLAGDMNDILGDETRLAPVIGKVDFLKLGHHGYIHSNTENFLKTLKPEYAVITNDYYNPDTNTIKLLEQLQTKYHYSTQDEKAVIVNMSNNKVEVKYEDSNGWKFIMGKWRNFETGVELPQIIKEEKTASSWEELSNLIATKESRTINLKNSNNWNVTKEIKIFKNQQITLVAEEPIYITRAENYKDTIIRNEGILNLGIENMAGSIIIDGNKTKVNAQASMISNIAILNISNKITLQNNKLTNISMHKGSAIENSGTYSQINILGAKIEANEVDAQNQYICNQITTTNALNIGVYGGAISLERGTLTMIKGRIGDNKIDNHSTVQITNCNLKDISTTSYGGAIHAKEACINLIGANIENNIVENHSNIDVKNSTIHYVNATSRGGAVSINNVKMYMNNDTNIKNNKANTNTNLTRAQDNIEVIDMKDSVGGAIYAYHGEVEIDQANIVQNQADMGGGISTSEETNVVIKTANIEKNQATKNAGGIFIEPNSSCKIEGGYFSTNVAKQNGNGIYQSGKLEIGKNININDNIYLSNGKTLIVSDKITNNSNLLIQCPTYRENQVIIENNTNQDILNKVVLLGQSQYYLKQNNNQILLVDQNKKPTTIVIKYSTQEITNTAVTVTIQADRELQAVSGWDRAKDKKQISKTFTKNTNEKIQITDSLGNKKEIPIKISNIYKIRRYESGWSNRYNGFTVAKNICYYGQ